MQGSGRGFDGIGTNARRTLFGHHNGIDSSALRRAHNGSEIADIGNAVERNHKRHPSLVKHLSHNIFNLAESNRRHQRYDSLVVFAGNAVEALNGHTLNRNVILANEFRKFLCQFVVLANLHQNFIDLLAKSDSLNYGADSENVIVGVAVLVVIHCVSFLRRKDRNFGGESIKGEGEVGRG